jgi:hypothetical protein
MHQAKWLLAFSSSARSRLVLRGRTEWWLLDPRTCSVWDLPILRWWARSEITGVLIGIVHTQSAITFRWRDGQNWWLFDSSKRDEWHNGWFTFRHPMVWGAEEDESVFAIAGHVRLRISWHIYFAGWRFTRTWRVLIRYARVISDSLLGTSQCIVSSSELCAD